MLPFPVQLIELTVTPSQMTSLGTSHSAKQAAFKERHRNDSAHMALFE